MTQKDHRELSAALDRITKSIANDESLPKKAAIGAVGTLAGFRLFLDEYYAKCRLKTLKSLPVDMDLEESVGFVRQFLDTIPSGISVDEAFRLLDSFTYHEARERLNKIDAWPTPVSTEFWLGLHQIEKLGDDIDTAARAALETILPAAQVAAEGGKEGGALYFPAEMLLMFRMGVEWNESKTI